MLLSFKGSLRGVEHKKSKQGNEYTIFKFDTIGGDDFSLSAKGTVIIDQSYLRKDMDWSLEVKPKTYGIQVTFEVLNIGGQVTADKSASAKK